MNQKTILLVIFILLFCFSPATVAAGNFIVGVKGWYASWDSSILDWFEQDIAQDFMDRRLSLTADSDPGTGYLAGPLLGYQTDDGKWSFSFAPMVFSSFTQDWNGAAGSMDLNSNVDLSRQDYDLSATYTLSKYLRVYAGWKIQIMEMDFNLSYETPARPQAFAYKVESTVHMPTAGIGLTYPVHEKVVLGLQLGVLYAVPELEITDQDNITRNLYPQPSFGYNSEANISFQPLERLVLQLGYRYQIFSLETVNIVDSDALEKWDSYDITHGCTMSVVYVF
jgi:long-subunit fatty acid transport protein